MRIPGPSLTELVDLGDQIAEATARAVRQVLTHTARDIGNVPSIDDLMSIRIYWDKTVDAKLMPLVATAYRHGVDGVHQAVTRSITDVPMDSLTAATADVVESSVPLVTNPHTEAYLTQARNRMVNVGNETWEHARGALLDGLHAGEGTTQLARRVVNSADLAIPRAEVVARTEVNGAANAGALDEMRIIGLPGTTKEWIATRGARTRPTHTAVDGETVALDGKFTVGGWPMDRPHDPSAPASETVNCRCTIGFDVADDAVAETFHLPGKHDQSTHGHGKIGDTDLDNPFQEPAVESVQSDYGHLTLNSNSEYFDQRATYKSEAHHPRDLIPTQNVHTMDPYGDPGNEGTGNPLGVRFRNSPKVYLIDGHHRAIARVQSDQPDWLRNNPMRMYVVDVDADGP